ncbi:MAG: hypothetical protein KDJ31_03345 [Candidatus Competibacteraceae bacterium]|nr:hypothetical protein [Candidatus Competibacteraceae bacterium]
MEVWNPLAQSAPRLLAGSGFPGIALPCSRYKALSVEVLTKCRVQKVDEENVLISG